MIFHPRTSSIVICLLASQLVINAQMPASTPAPTPAPASKTKPSTTKKVVAQIDPQIEARRTLAVSLLSSLADEARSFRDLAQRSRVQARTAAALWASDPESARSLFKRAWDSAEAADEENSKRSEEEVRTLLASRGTTASRQRPNLRREVLRLAARHDRELGEEFLRKLEEARKLEAEKTPNASPQTPTRINPDDPPQAMAQRLSLARQLLEDGDIPRALQFADSALYPINTFGINILDMLHEKDAAAADQRYVALLSRAISDPVSDANTISLLSSYVFHPFLYITVKPDGNSHTRQWRGNMGPPSDITPAMRNAFFRTAASVLLGPTPEPDLSSSGRQGTYVVIARMLQLFEKFGHGQAPALRARMAMLVNDVPERMRQDNPLLTRGIVPEDQSRDGVQESLDRLPKAKTPEERDRLYYQAAMAARNSDFDKARDLADKIEDSELRQQVQGYITFDAMRGAIRKKNADDALSLARSMELTTVQRAWGLAEIGGLLATTDATRAAEALDLALAESRRIEQSSPDRARTLIAAVTHLQKVDSEKAWGMMSEVIKAANSASGFSGEDGELTTRIAFRGGGAMTNNFSVETFDLAGLFAALAREDFDRAADLPKGFTGESPRAVALLAVAQVALDRK